MELVRSKSWRMSRAESSRVDPESSRIDEPIFADQDSPRTMAVMRNSYDDFDVVKDNISLGDLALFVKKRQA